MERRKFTREFKLEAVRLIKDRGVSYVQASQDLGVHVSQLRDWVKKFADDPEHAFPGHGQMKPEQLEIARLKREVTKLKSARRVWKDMLAEGLSCGLHQIERLMRLQALKARPRRRRLEATVRQLAFAKINEQAAQANRWKPARHGEAHSPAGERHRRRASGGRGRHGNEGPGGATAGDDRKMNNEPLEREPI
jgi:transposase